MAEHYSGEPAATAVSVGSAGCAGTGAVGTSVRVQSNDGATRPAADPLGALRLPSGAALGC